jgi:hypothetical protein|tara:strand:- start:1049 stop:1366 length:318 start_codon:yes stop_codon:yes gene_type:complete
MDLDNNKVIAQYWILKDVLSPACSTSIPLFSYPYRPGRYIADYKKSKTFKVIGTRLQIYELFCEMFDRYGWQLRDSGDEELTQENLELYNKTKKPLLININYIGL